MPKLELIIEHNGVAFAPPVESDVQIEWNRTDSCGKMTFTTIKVDDPVMNIQEGDRVTFKCDDKPVFLGYVFTKSRDKEHRIEITCYDQLRYFKNKYTYLFTKKTATQIIQALCKDFNLQIGTMENTNYIIPLVEEENKSAFDIALGTLQDTLMATGEMYVLYDDYGKLNLKNVNSMKTGMLIYDENAENFTYKSSIDDETYNSVVLYYKPKSNSSDQSANEQASGQASAVISTASAEVGYAENAVRLTSTINNCKYNTEYYGQEVAGNAYPWCAVFVWWVFNHAGCGGLVTRTASCATLMSWFKGQGRFYKSNPKVGDVVFYSWSGSGANHVGIVESVNNSGTIVTIEGNTSNRVKRMVRSQGASILGYGRPAYSGGSTVVPKDNTAIQVFSAQDNQNISKWGTLRYFDNIDDPKNGQGKADQLLRLYNRKTRELQISGIQGDLNVRGGSLVPVQLNLGDINAKNYMLVGKVVHSFNDDSHLMDITVEGSF